MPFGPENEHEAFVEGYTARRGVLSQQNKTVVRPIPRIDSDVIKRKKTGGRKKQYTPTRMKNTINKYFQFCEENDEVPSIKGMMIHLKMYPESFYLYLKYPEFTDIMEHARLIISHWMEMDVYSTKGMAAGKIAYMKNVHDWCEKTQTKNQTEVRVISVDEARAKIEMLAPKLLEILNSSMTVNQIAAPVIEAEFEEGK
jgi:hypothetical protein